MIHILIQYVLLAAGLIGSLALFVSVKREIQRNAAKSCKRIEDVAARINEVPPRDAAEPVLVYSAPRSGLNMNKRVQAMRMVRRHEGIATIAAALGVTRKEIELLIRVQGISRAATNASSS